MSEKEKVEGYVEHIIFRNEENGYTVLNLSMKGRELTCVGTLPMIGEGELIEASGDYIEHAAYGKQFRIESYETKVPQDSVALERYLGSGAIKGVGAALAARIVRRFGDDTLRIIEEEPERQEADANPHAACRRLLADVCGGHIHTNELHCQGRRLLDLFLHHLRPLYFQGGIYQCLKLY